ncbi:MAG: PilZ domain-containing protein [Planctomycetota bacterium]
MERLSDSFRENLPKPGSATTDSPRIALSRPEPGMFQKNRILEVRPIGRGAGGGRAWIDGLAPRDPSRGRGGRERRRHPRWPIARACKVLPAGTARYEPATTADVSAGGARLFIDTQRAFAVGDPVELAVAWDAQPTLRSGETVAARVVRVDMFDDAERYAIAVEFDRPVALASVIDVRDAA